jgi:hypothetical protein
MLRQKYLKKQSPTPQNVGSLGRTSVNPMPNAQVCVYLMVHITKLPHPGPHQ